MPPAQALVRCTAVHCNLQEPTSQGSHRALACSKPGPSAAWASRCHAGLASRLPDVGVVLSRAVLPGGARWSMASGHSMPLLRRAQRTLCMSLSCEPLEHSSRRRRLQGRSRQAPPARAELAPVRCMQQQRAAQRPLQAPAAPPRAQLQALPALPLLLAGVAPPHCHSRSAQPRCHSQPPTRLLRGSRCHWGTVAPLLRRRVNSRRPLRQRPCWLQAPAPQGSTLPQQHRPQRPRRRRLRGRPPRVLPTMRQPRRRHPRWLPPRLRARPSLPLPAALRALPPPPRQQVPPLSPAMRCPHQPLPLLPRR